MKEIAHVDRLHLCVIVGDVYQSRGFVTQKMTVMTILMKEIAQFLLVVSCNYSH